MSEFRDTAPSAPAVFYRSYSRRKPDGTRESYEEAITRAVNDLADIGGLNDEQRALCLEMGLRQHTLPSGRALWVAGTEWAKKRDNFPGYYNCCSLQVEHIGIFGLLMELAMMGVGTGAVLERSVVEKLPSIKRRLEIVEVIENKKKRGGQDKTEIKLVGYQDDHPVIKVTVGDSRQGWASAYQGLIELATGTLAQEEDEIESETALIKLDLSQIRQAGERLKGFGGVANPIRLRTTFERVAAVLAKALGRKLTAIECCLLIDEAASAVVAGNIRRCLPENALVHTSKGLVPIADVQIGDMVQTPIGFKRVVDKFDQGIQNVYELDTNGPIPRGTLEHRYAVLKDATGGVDWVKVKDLNESDRLLHSTLVLSGQHTALPPDFTEQRPSGSSTTKRIDIPNLDSSVAWLIGFTHGDGYVSVGRNKHNKPYGAISWATNALKETEAQMIYEKINSALSRFGVSAACTKVRGENTVKITCSSIRLAEYFLEHIKQPKTPLNIPDFILRGTPEIRAGYLAGLMDSDGSIAGRPPILVTTIYKDFARQVAALLSSLGIAGRCRVTAPQKQNWQIRHHVTLPALKSRYNDLIAPYSVKGRIKEGLKMYGFTVPGQIMREAYACVEMNSMGFSASRKVDANYETYMAETDIDLDIPVTFKEISGYDSIQTYDIEVEEAHCFYCDGYLTHNSAGMKQFSSDDLEAATAKEGLYKQGEDGSWSVDPEKEALRMSNHTRCYHYKPSYEEIESAVTKQFYSGEGAIQYVPEMIARANADLLNTKDAKKDFLRLYLSDGKEAGKKFLKELAVKQGKPVDAKILEHRITRYGLNPCLTGDAKILTVHQGIKTFEELAASGEDVLVWCVNKETNEAAVRMMRNPRVTSYDEPVLEIKFDSGLKVRATYDHNFFTLQRNKVKAKKLRVGQSVAAFAMHQHHDGHLRVVRNDKTTNSVRQQFCHRIVAEYYGISGEVIHHIDGNPVNNNPQNLEGMTVEAHNKEHYPDRCRKGFYHKTPGPIAAEYIANHKVVSIREAGNAPVYNGTVDEHHNYVIVDPVAVGKSYVSGILSANCGEIALRDNVCNLSEINVNTIDPVNRELQKKAFYAGGLQVASLLQHKFVPEELAYSRKNDPIVGVGLTGGFDFFVHLFGADWLEWMMRGRPTGNKFKRYTQAEQDYLTMWRRAAEAGVKDYCQQAGIEAPNRYTDLQPSGSKSLLTGASPGWHPPKAQRFIRRITFGKHDPLVAALRDYGYSVIPAQSARDEVGNLLDDVNDPRVHEVLVEIPTEVSWANLPGCDQFDLAQLPIESQWGFYMQFQNYYTTHNTSATLEFREHEIGKLSKLIYDNIQQDGGYISAALLARFDANETFPRLPFEPIDKITYDRLQAGIQAYRATLPEDTSILDLLKPYDHPDHVLEPQDTACANGACLAKIDQEEAMGLGSTAS